MDDVKHAYVLITPARNEENSIEKTVQSVISQTVRPKKWVVVSDGSTDRTDKIVLKYTRQYDWIELLRSPEHDDRHFAAKVNCFNAGYQQMQGVDYEFIGNLDADISFVPDYFAYLLGRFDNDPGLGVVGTPFVEDGSKVYDYRFTNIEHVSGACQLFRRSCFEEIGGYTPIKGGGIDWVAVTTARMKGWKTRTFTDRICYHHRKIGTGNNGPLAACFNQGKKDCYLGGHPIWQLFRACYQMAAGKPRIVGGLALLSGYIWALMSGAEKPVSEGLIQFHRGEQMRRLRKFFVNRHD